VSNWIVSGADSTTPQGGRPAGDDEPGRSARPWPPPGPDTGWWRDDGAPRPFTPSGTRDEPAPPASGQYRSGAPGPRSALQRHSTEPVAVAEPDILDAEIVDDDRPAIEATPARRTSNVGPEGFPTHRMRPAAQAGTAVAPAHATGDATDRIPISPAGPDDGWLAAGLRVQVGHRGDTPAPPSGGRPPKDPRRPLAGLAGLLIFALLATFLSWFAAGPLWLSVGHGTYGLATVVDCPVDGLSRRCADFAAADRSFTAYVALLGPNSMHAGAGAQVPARMVNKDASTAYAGDTASLYLRWVPSVLLALLCGLGIAWATGVARLPRRRARWVAGLGSLLAPLLLLVGMLVVTF
jgi:hypothetical protein